MGDLASQNDGSLRARATAAEQVRAYLRTLPANTVAGLLIQLEKAALAGEADQNTEFLVDELRQITRELGASRPRLGNASRVFFRPVEPFLVDRDPVRHQTGRIARSALGPIWQWIARDLIPDEARRYGEAIVAPLLVGDERAVADICDAFQGVAAARISAALADAADDEAADLRLNAQLGGPRVRADLADIAVILRHRTVLSMLDRRMPAAIRNVGDEQLENLLALLDAPPVRREGLQAFAAALLIGRLANPAHLVRIAVRGGETDIASKLAGGRFAGLIDLVVGEIEAEAAAMPAALREGADVAAARVKDLHDAIRVLRTDLDLSGENPWTRRLAALRTDLARALGAEVETLPGRIRRILKLRSGAETGLVLDEVEVSAIEAGLDLLAACRSAAAEIAMNEITLRVYSDIQSFLEGGSTALIDAFRVQAPGDNVYRKRQIQAAVRFTAKVFGTSYASLVAKAADVAAAAEKRTA
jgi:hypothetical protein